MAQTISPRLYEKTSVKNQIYKASDICILFLMCSLLVYRFLTLKSHGFAWFLALLCESWFTFLWVLVVSSKWNPVKFITYPERLPQRAEELLPRVDMFVTTADPALEPAIVTMNTVLSLLAVDYPVDKLACYVSDDGCSSITYYSLVETSKFAKIWVPFCKKYNIQVRAPFRYFTNNDSVHLSSPNSLEFQQDWRIIKDEYEKFSRKIKDASLKFIPLDSKTADFNIFSNIDRRNHPTIIKVIWENKESVSSVGLPHLIYVSREKRPKYPHHYKAGAMNVLTRVSGLMTNAPLMLNVDCDMYANDPQIVRHALCFLLGSESFAFVQFPQMFYDELKDDPFGNSLFVLYEYMGRGIAGVQGPFYGGTGCFHRRKVIYGLSPPDLENQPKNLTPVCGNLADVELVKLFGKSMEFKTSAAEALEEKDRGMPSNFNLVEAANEVAGCGYEYGTAWGAEIGWRYGSTTEDVLTGLNIHSKGWKSAFCTPQTPAFLGCSPSTGPSSMTQQKRWATGLLEILVSKNNPIISAVTAKLQLRQCLAYLWILLWGLRSIPELCYMLLPAYCLVSNSNFLPKFNEPPIYGYLALVIIYCLYTILQYLQNGMSVLSWWNKLRMSRIISVSSWLFGVLSVVLKILGLSETVFEVTQKDQATDDDASDDVGRFTFDGSPIFVPATTVLFVELSALGLGLCGGGARVLGSQVGEILCSVIVVIFLWPFFKGLFGKGKYGIPLPTICKSAVLALCFVHFCK
ncbi:cellulose synthase-like protein B3 [Mercurialis annua]|uniref:cellulose synthase-like protein B3 n=1 Tax=Mercurialis annua TaxID=3986 RepID=UPI002160030F|nr:cellulose synthase-like protein B3 [Mercurialis annua]